MGGLRAGLPDLVVLDIGLPLVDGLEMCRRLRTRSDSLPIIFVTSREDEFDRVLGLEIGADDYCASRSRCASYGQGQGAAAPRVRSRTSRVPRRITVICGRW